MGVGAGWIVCVAVIALAGCTRAENEDGAAASTLPPADTTETTGTTSVPDTTAPPTSSLPADSVAATSVPSTTSPTSQPTTAAPATTAPTTTAPATTAPPTTVGTPASVDDLTLAADGILPLRFGDRDLDVVAVLTEVFGSPSVDTTTEYPTADEGLFLDATGEEAFIAPFGRGVCWPDGLCVQFGAGAPETRIFTGWSIAPTATGEATSALTTGDGIGLGTVLDDVADRVTYDPAAACFTVAFGFASGVEVTLQSGDGVFSAPDEDGSGMVIGDPDPAEITVTQLAAGERPFFVFADC